jgi:hypothetical protein
MFMEVVEECTAGLPERFDGSFGGRLYVFGGHGQADHLMCQGAREQKCWNGATVDAPLAATKTAEAVSREVESLEDFEPVFLEMLSEEARKASESLDAELARLQGRKRVLETEAANLLQFLKDGSQSERVRGELRHGRPGGPKNKGRKIEVNSRPVSPSPQEPPESCEGCQLTT